MYTLIFKYILDRTISLLLLMSFSPIFLFVTITLLIVNKGSPLFYQTRLGKKGQVFKIIKFKTMNDRKDDKGNLLKDSDRLFPFGKLMRRLKIDELPQLINVLKGEMSLVGPRPCLPQLLFEFDENGKKRLQVKPGLTGLAQVNGNISLIWPERWKYDRFYVENLSFRLDAKILLKTIGIVIFGEAKFSKEYVD